MSLPSGMKEQKTGQDGERTINTLYFYLTEGCNLACRHCWMGPRFDATGSHYPTLPVEVFETAIREAKPLGLTGVKLTGGEPLLHPEFTRFLEIVRREELKLTLETNGLLCTPEIAAEIAKSTNRFVSVSIDGTDAATHEWVRGVPGSFKAAQQAVRNLVATGTRPQVIFTVMRSNAGQVNAIVHMAEELGAASVKFNVVQPTARGEKLHEVQETLSIAELIELGRHVEQELAPKTKLKLFFHSHCWRGWVRRLRDLRYPGCYRRRTLCPVRHRRASTGSGLWRGREGQAGRGVARKRHLEGSAGGTARAAGGGLQPLPDEVALHGLVHCPELLQKWQPVGAKLVL
jgi:MoaA/NifB/PqqE/SkfB family radical SAM enzyme